MSRSDTATKKTDRDLTPKQHDVLLALLSGHSQANAAKKGGVGVATVKRWLRLPEFREALRDLQADRIRQTTNVLVGFGVDGALLLRKMADDATAPHSVRVRAAAVLLRESREHLQLADLEQRLSDLEATVTRREGLE